MSSKRTVCVHWFRKGLRIHDNPSLLASFEPLDKEDDDSRPELRPVFVLDPWFVANMNVGPNRWRFLQESLTDLDASLRKVGTRLFVIRGKPKEVFETIFEDWNVKRLTFEVDTEPYAKIRDEEISNLAVSKFGIEVVTKTSHTLFNPNDIVRANFGNTPLTYQKLCGLVSQIGPPPKPVEALEKLPKNCRLTSLKNDDEYDPPTLEELLGKKFEDKLEILDGFPFPGGETAALERMDLHITEKKGAWVRSFEKPNTSPNSLEPSTTVLSPYLKFGCLSVRTMYWRLQEILKKGKHSQPPVSLVGQLLWREFFYTCGAHIENFDRMKGNSVCKQIPWDTNEEYLSAWKEGRTGYPFIDAIMTQLRKEGWIHHLARHSVACFLTRGDLWISWEEGQRVFEEYLLDADWSLNAGNWMWLSASAFFHQYYRVYSPIVFGKKTDPNGLYIRKWLPQLAKFPDKYIYEPWEAPKKVQEACNCIIGKDYPEPIVDHSKISKINIGRMKEAYSSSNNQSPEKSSGKKRKEDDNEDGGKGKSGKKGKTIKDYFKK